MADAFLQFMVGKLALLIQNEIVKIWGVDKEMENLSSLFTTIKTVLKDAEEKQIGDPPIQNWLRKLKDAAYKVDDILDECATEAALLESNRRNSSFINKVRSSCLTPHNSILFRHKIGSRMRDIREKLDKIAEERLRFHLAEGGVERRSRVIENRQTGSIVTQPRVYGRDEDKERIVECLEKKVAGSDELSVYPIVGLGGLGKTTLAQMVFNDKRIMSHFEPRIWVCVSEDFCVSRILKAIIESATESACDDLQLGPLQKKLQAILNGKRFLLVLDDIWNEDQEKWDSLKCVLACGSRGASIIVTTRIQTVASIMGTMPLHQLSGLTEDDCWSLFKERAFRQETEERPNLVALGKEIVKKCGGVPLAVKSLGSLMSNKSEENQWVSVVKSELWNLSQHENSILPALRLSYSNLPSNLKQCFAYCAIFPKDFVIEKELLIQLWMANGFISSTENLDPEDIGNEICKELCWRSFLEDLGEDDFGNNKGFKMHDLVHDLAQFITEDECLSKRIEISTVISKRTFHYSWMNHTWEPYHSLKALYGVETLRTFLVHSRYLYHDSVSCLDFSSRLCSLRVYSARSVSCLDFSSRLCSFGVYRARFQSSFDFSRLSSLRVFSARFWQLRKLSSSICCLKHLRYLDLSVTSIQVLPESICTLYNLQTLNLNECRYLRKLPKHMRRLKNLRHLYLDGCHKLSEMPPKIGQFTCLKTLTRFIVGKERGYHLDELKDLNLGGKLRIDHLQRVKNPRDAKEANLVGKRNLLRLCLYWEDDSDLQSQEDVEKVLEALKPHANLKQLDISGYKGAQFPSWLRDNILDNLVYIKLSNCDKCSQLPPLALLPCLRTLDLDNMSQVMYIDDHFQGGGTTIGFPSLQSLKIYNLPSLQRFSREDGRELLPCLTSLEINGSPKLTLPHLPSVKQLVVWNCNEVILGSVSNLKNLISLEFVGNHELNYLPDGMLLNLTSLKTLKVDMFWKLKCLPTEIVSLTSLETLDIWSSDELESFPEQGMDGLKCLKYLSLIYCRKFTTLTEGLQHLSCLETLSLVDCPELVALPDGMKYLTSLRNLVLYPGFDSKLEVLPDALRYVPALQSLSIGKYLNLASLPDWLGDLTSLQTLRIFHCPKLSSLPASIQRLTMLQKLYIAECHELKKRCEKGKGEDWYKIAHIPNVEIG